MHVITRFVAAAATLVWPQPKGATKEQPMRTTPARSRPRAVLTIAVSGALVVVASLVSAPAASAAEPAPVGRCGAWVPVKTVIWFPKRVVRTAVRVRSCTQVVAYTGTYRGKRRAALRITGTAQVWNTNAKGSLTPPLGLSLLINVTDAGVNRQAKFYFKTIKPGATASYRTTTTAWLVKGRTAKTEASGVSSDSPANWSNSFSYWKH